MFPKHRPYVDGRLVLHDAAFLSEFLYHFDNPDTFYRWPERKYFTLAVLPIGEDGRYLPLAAAWVRSGEMKALYCDGADLLLASPKAWRGGEEPETWTNSLGMAAARKRFGANLLLLSRAVERIELWRNLSELR